MRNYIRKRGELTGAGSLAVFLYNQNILPLYSLCLGVKQGGDRAETIDTNDFYYIDELAKYGFDFNIQDANGSTVLMQAAYIGTNFLTVSKIGYIASFCKAALKYTETSIRDRLNETVEDILIRTIERLKLDRMSNKNMGSTENGSCDTLHALSPLETLLDRIRKMPKTEALILESVAKTATADVDKQIVRVITRYLYR